MHNRAHDADQGMTTGKVSMSEITEEDCKEIVRKTRAFYKRGLGSAIKLYEERSESDKKTRRNSSAPFASRYKAGIRKRIQDNPQMTVRDHGRWIVEARQNWGDCGEMSYVAVHYCHETESFRQKAAHIWLVSTRPESLADHMFVMVASVGATATGSDTIHQLARTDNSGLWVIDAWMKIACPANLYYGAILGTFYRWRIPGKVIAPGADLEELGEEAQVGPRGIAPYASFFPNLVNSPLGYIPVKDLV
jgi:hypothetical protein